MYKLNTMKYGKAIKIINAGEFYVSSSDEFIETLLGSCVAVCLYDPINQISGMNHFMLPGKISKVDIFQERSAQYGVIAIEKLLNEMIKKGAEKKNLIAKVFGGGSVIEFKNEKAVHAVPLDNIRLAKVILEMEDIPISKIDVGDSFTRKILMDVKTGAVYVRKTTSKEVFEDARARKTTSYTVY